MKHESLKKYDIQNKEKFFDGFLFLIVRENSETFSAFLKQEYLEKYDIQNKEKIFEGFLF